MIIPLRYNLRSVAARKVTSLLTTGAIGLVVLVLVSLLAMSESLSRTLVATGTPGNVIFLKRGAIAEIASFISEEEAKLVLSHPALARDAAGESQLSPELLLQVLLERRDGLMGSVLVRGVRAVAFGVHPAVRLVRGRMPRPGSYELITGTSLTRRFRRMEVGEVLHLGRHAWRVVGQFEAAGSAYGSEVWADLDGLRADTRRWYLSALHGKLRHGGWETRLRTEVEKDPRLDLAVKSEISHYREQSEQVWVLRSMVLFVISLMAIGAGFAAMNTMYGAISYRIKEIATLRVLGFSRRSIEIAFVLESMMLVLPGAIVGCLLPFPLLHGSMGGTLNVASLSEVVFEIRVTPGILAIALVFALTIGIAGGVLPARAAGRLGLREALREI